MASGNTSVPIVSAAGGTGKEFFSGSEEKNTEAKKRRGKSEKHGGQGRTVRHGSQVGERR